MCAGAEKSTLIKMLIDRLGMTLTDHNAAFTSPVTSSNNDRVPTTLGLNTLSTERAIGVSQVNGQGAPSGVCSFGLFVGYQGTHATIRRVGRNTSSAHANTKTSGGIRRVEGRSNGGDGRAARLARLVEVYPSTPNLILTVWSYIWATTTHSHLVWLSFCTLSEVIMEEKHSSKEEYKHVWASKVGLARSCEALCPGLLCCAVVVHHPARTEHSTCIISNSNTLLVPLGATKAAGMALRNRGLVSRDARTAVGQLAVIIYVPPTFP